MAPAPPRPAAPVLHRDNPDRDPLVGHVKVTREDWLNMARAVLISHGVAEVKILALGQRLGVSRSSFYWYFKSRAQLLEALLGDWEARNTHSIVAACTRPATDICEAACNFFRCFFDPGKFDQGLDFAVREWSRRDGAVRQRIDAADRARLTALTGMYIHHGYAPQDADIRARVIYFMQLGYHALEIREPLETRLARVPGYLRAFTGQDPAPETVASFRAFAHSLPNAG